MGRQISVSTLEQITGALSAFACFLIVLTYFKFSEIRGLRYIELVFYVASNVLIASVGISIGAAQNPSQCWFQEITTNFNYLSAIFWTTVITFQVWLVVHHKVVLTNSNMIKFHALCWGLPLFVTFIPLTTNTYGSDDANPWCFIAERSDSPAWGILVWPWLSFYVWLYIAIFVNVSLVISISVHLRRMAVVSNDITATIQKLLIYPMIFFVCWGATTIYDIYGMFHPLSDDNSEVAGWNRFVTTLSILQGVLFAAAFFSINQNIRKLWVDFIFQRPDYVRRQKRMKALKAGTVVNTNSSSNVSTSRASQFSCTWEDANNFSGPNGDEWTVEMENDHDVDHINLSTAGSSIFEIMGGGEKRYSSDCLSGDSAALARQESHTGVGLSALGIATSPNSNSNNHISSAHNSSGNIASVATSPNAINISKINGNYNPNTAHHHSINQSGSYTGNSILNPISSSVGNNSISSVSSSDRIGGDGPLYI